MACVSSCPSGVRYDRLIESTRAAVEDEVERPLGDRFVRGLLFRLLPYPGRMRAALTLAPIGRALPMPRTAPAARRDRSALARDTATSRRVTPAAGPPRARVGLLTGCVQRAVFPDVNAATARVLAADGFEVVAPPQGCCGALSVHAGRRRGGEGVRPRTRRCIPERRPRRRELLGLRVAPEGARLAPRRRARGVVLGEGPRRRRAARRATCHARLAIPSR